MDAMQILVIILSVFLAIFLLLGIILIVLLIKVTQHIRKVTQTAQSAAEHLNSFAANATKFTTPAVIGRMLYRQFKKFKK